MSHPSWPRENEQSCFWLCCMYEIRAANTNTAILPRASSVLQCWTGVLWWKHAPTGLFIMSRISYRSCKICLLSSPCTKNLCAVSCTYMRWKRFFWCLLPAQSAVNVMTWRLFRVSYTGYFHSVSRAPLPSYVFSSTIAVACGNSFSNCPSHSHECDIPETSGPGDD